jgi:hypothetical protein
MALKPYKAYRNPELDIWYWPTNSGLEVGFVLGALWSGNLDIWVNMSP